MGINLVENENKNALKRFEYECNIKFSNGGNSSNTRVSAVNKFISYINSNNIKISEVTHHVVESFLEEELEKKVSKPTVDNYYSYLKGFFKFLKINEDNIVMDYSKINFSRTKLHVFATFSNGELKELFDIIKFQKKEDIRLSNTIIFKILLLTGCTLGEVSSIFVYQKEKDFDDDDNYIIIENKILHFNNPSRNFILMQDLINIINKYHKLTLKLDNLEELRARECLLNTFYNGQVRPMRYTTIQNRMKAIKDKSSFKDKELSVKNIRHTVIKKLLEKYSIDKVSEIVGLDIGSLKLYLDNDKEPIFDVEYFKKHPFRSILD